MDNKLKSFKKYKYVVYIIIKLYKNQSIFKIQKNLCIFLFILVRIYESNDFKKPHFLLLNE